MFVYHLYGDELFRLMGFSKLKYLYRLELFSIVLFSVSVRIVLRDFRPCVPSGAKLIPRGRCKRDAEVSENLQTSETNEVRQLEECRVKDVIR
jgi:hypothetical protein